MGWAAITDKNELEIGIWGDGPSDIAGDLADKIFGADVIESLREYRWNLHFENGKYSEGNEQSIEAYANLLLAHAEYREKMHEEYNQCWGRGVNEFELKYHIDFVLGSKLYDTEEMVY